MRGWIGLLVGRPAGETWAVVGYPPAVGKLERKHLQALVEDATVDCHEPSPEGAQWIEAYRHWAG